MHKILFLSHTPYIENDDHFLGTKLKNELSKYFETTQINYHAKGHKKNIEGCINIELKFENKGTIKKLRNLLFMYRKNLKIIKKGDYELIWVGVTSNIISFFIFIYPLFTTRQKFYVQTFTPSVKPSKIKRFWADLFLSLNLHFFNHVGVGSNRNVDAYRLKERQAVFHEVGIPDYGFQPKDFIKLNLLYIGTLNSREIWKSVKGVGIFIQKNPHVKLEYNIIGAGNNDEVSKLEQTIDECRLDDKVKYHGFLSIEKVKKHFLYSNIGIAFVPINKYFENPSTKTLEYLISGMPVIATDDIIKRNIINEDCGVLIEDNPESFAAGLEKMVKNIKHYNPQKIREMFLDYSMESSIKRGYIPKLIDIIKTNSDA